MPKLFHRVPRILTDETAYGVTIFKEFFSPSSQAFSFQCSLFSNTAFLFFVARKSKFFFKD